MSIDRLLNTSVLRNLRNAAATIRAIAFFATIIVASAVLVYLTFGSDLIEPDAALAAGIGLVALIVTVAIFGYYNKYHHDPPFYEIVELDAELMISPAGDHRRYVYTRRQRVRALRDELRLVEFRAHWTGGASRDKIEVDSLISGHALLDGKEREDTGHVHRWIYPRRCLDKGQEADVGIRQVHEDDVERQRPYFRDGGGRYRAHKVTVTARFPMDEDPRLIGEVEGKVWNSNRPIRQHNPVEDISVVRTVNRGANTVDYVVTTNNPKKYHSYGIQWSWS